MGTRASAVYRCPSVNPVSGKRCRLWPQHRSLHRWWDGSIFWVAGSHREEWKDKI